MVFYRPLADHRYQELARFVARITPLMHRLAKNVHVAFREKEDLGAPGWRFKADPLGGCVVGCRVRRAVHRDIRKDKEAATV
jgi:hypothetical protein